MAHAITTSNLRRLGVLEHGIEARALVASLSTTDASVAVDLLDGPATAFGDTA